MNLLLPAYKRFIFAIFLTFASFGVHAQLHAPVSCGSTATHGLIDWSTTPAGLSQFDWLPSGSLVNTLSNISGTGVDANISFAGETATLGAWGINQTPSVGTAPTDGGLECLELFTNGFGATGISITMDFNVAIGEIAFDLANVNSIPGANGDLYTITATNSLGVTVFPTFTSSATPSYVTDGIGNVDAILPSTAGDDDEVGINLSDPSGLVSFTVTWKNCTSCAPFFVHGLGIMDVEFCVSDVDLDALQDLVDIDDDNDGIPDVIETGGLDPTEDLDNDGVYAYLDDDDNDPLVLNNNAMVESAYDFDGDNVPNHFDLDSDNDGISDIVEAGGEDINGDGQVDYPTAGDPSTMIDADADGLSDFYDSNIPVLSVIDISIDLDEYEDETTWALTGPLGNTVASGGPYIDGNDIITSSSSATQSGTYTFTITDSFGDGISLNGGSDENAASNYTIDVDGANVFASPASHSFGFSNSVPIVITLSSGVSGMDIPLYNTDLVGNPDFLDLDSDNDGLGDNIELNLGSTIDDLGGGTTLDGMIGDLGIIDANGNGWSDADEGPDARIDSDGDDNFDLLEKDSDNDGIRDFLEGVCTFCPSFGNDANIDSDGDGFSDQYENLTTANANGGGNQGLNPNDHDGDGTPDYLDIDTDNDGGFDWTEGYDVSGDGYAAPEFETTAIAYALAGGLAADYPITNSDTDIVPDFADNQPFVHGYVETTRPPFFVSWSPSWVDNDKDGLVDLLDEDVLGAAFGQYAPLPNTDGILDRDWRDVNSVIILPVVLLSFTATPLEREVLLEWATASEKDNDYFTLERSGDAKTWIELAEVDAIGNSTSISEYNWTDFQPLNGVSYYRLKVVDINQFSEYSHIEVVNRTQTDEILVYPNPALDKVTLKANFETASRIDIVSITGTIITSVEAPGNNTVTFDVSSLAAGCYYFSFLTKDGDRTTRKLVVGTK